MSGATLRGFALGAGAAALAAVLLPEAAFRASRGGSLEALRARQLEYRRALPVEKKGPRALAIGGSITYGAGVDAGQAWPGALERLLRAEADWEVINLGRPGGNLEEFRLNLRSAADRRLFREDFLRGAARAPSRFVGRDGAARAPSRFVGRDGAARTPSRFVGRDGAARAKEGNGPGWLALAPDLVLIAPQLNDTAPDLYDLFQAERAPRERRALALLESGWRRRSALAHELRRWLHGRIETELAGGGWTPSAEAKERVAAGAADRLAAFAAAWKGTGASVVLVKFPVLFQERDGPAEAEAGARALGLPAGALAQKDLLTAADELDRRVLKAAAEAAGVPYVCAGCDLETRPFAERVRFFVDMIHMNPAGHLRAADALAAFLRQRS